MARKSSAERSVTGKPITEKPVSVRRSGCPVSAALELLGDRWSLLLIRDMMVRGYRTFREFQHSGEGIASNILSNRLQRLEAHGLVEGEPVAEDGRSIHYRLTEKGIALAPVMLELLIWGAHYEETGAPCAVIEHMEQNRAAVLAETYRRWKERDPEPILPPFPMQSQPKVPKGASKR
ncbi:MAG TPA: helix-turn-helix domain-containing protein [Terracidiphilus sp.]|nr:helix-turn-helix domain-containing protein [Terracidiphilus sp.]